MAKYRDEEDELDDEEDRYFSRLEDEEDAYLADLYDAPEVIDFGDDDDEILDTSLFCQYRGISRRQVICRFFSICE
ncbi:MAG: hypothetical protein EOM68_17710 [Spirochaetia bacterium]|nr:hypothetical protein [Spirochaetia bacterium]